MVTRITRVLPSKAEGIRSGEAVPVVIYYNAEASGLPIKASSVSSEFSVVLTGAAAEVGDENKLELSLVLTREGVASMRECMVRFQIGESRPFEALFAVEAR